MPETPIQQRFLPGGRVSEPPEEPTFYLCPCCECYHPVEWDGDCRDDARRLNADDLDARYGPGGWVEVELS